MQIRNDEDLAFGLFHKNLCRKRRKTAAVKHVLEHHVFRDGPDS